MKMTPAEMVLKDMTTYLAKIQMRPYEPKLPRGVKVSKEDEFFWTEYHRREVRAIEFMIGRQELRVERAREKLSRDCEAEGDTAKQDQELSQDISLRQKEKRQDKVRSLFRHLHHTSS